MKFLAFFSIIFFSKEFLPISYELVIITAIIFIFAWLKKNLQPLFLNFFESEKINAASLFQVIINRSIENYTPQNFLALDSFLNSLEDFFKFKINDFYDLLPTPEQLPIVLNNKFINEINLIKTY